MRHFRAFFIVIVMLVVGAAHAQEAVSITLFLDEDSLTMLVPESGLVSLDGIGLEVDTGAGLVTRFLQDYPSFRGLPFDSLPTPICLRLERSQSDAPLPISCPAQANRLFIQTLANADIFWFDSATNQGRTVRLMRRSEVLDFCAAGQSECSLQYIPLQAFTTPSPVLTNTPIGGSSGQIAFVSMRDGNEEIYLMNADGSNPINLTNNLSRDLFPIWSSDGSKIIFLTDRDGDWDYFVMGADGSNPTNVTRDRLHSWSNATFSPDGTKIAFSLWENDNTRYNIFLINLDGSESRSLTDMTGDELYPAWSPNGDFIAYSSGSDDDRHIYLMHADGTNKVDLTAIIAPDVHQVIHSVPKWSPDSKQLIFEEFTENRWEIYTLTLSDFQVQTLTDNNVTDRNPSWSPDGSLIAFDSWRAENWDIIIMNADGSNSTRITSGEGDNMQPVWRP